MRSRFTSGLLAAALAAGMVTVGAPQARASSSGRRNFALGLGAVAAYELLRGKTTPGLLAAAGAAYAYKRYSDARKSERRYRYYSNGYSGAPYYSGRAGYPYGSYAGTSGYSYQNDYGVTDDGTRYARRHVGPYTTDTWGNRRYYDPRYGDGEQLYGAHYSRRYHTAAYRDTPSGWHHGRKRGWLGH